MKTTISIVLGLCFLLMGFILYSSESNLRNINPADIKMKSWIFIVNPLDHLLFFQRQNEDGIFFIPFNFGCVYLKDSYIYDAQFREKCEGKITPLWITSSTHLPGAFDHYDPFYIRSNLPSSIYTERWMFDFKNRVYGSAQLILQNPNKDEVFGYKTPIWSQSMWRFIDYEFTHQKRPLIITEEDFQNLFDSSLSTSQCYKNGIISGKFILVDNAYYNMVNKIKEKSTYFQKPYFKKVTIGENMKWSNPHHKRKEKYSDEIIRLFKESSQSVDSQNLDTGVLTFPIMLIDPIYHSTRFDKNDWSISVYLNSKTGDFFQYFFFEKELDYEWPLFLRNWALDYLAGVHLCKKSTVGLALNPKERIIVSNSKKEFNPRKILLALNEKNEPWRPEPVPENKQTIDKNRLYYKPQPERLFGSACKVWELDIWQRVGYMLKTHPEGIYLVGYGTLLQAEETQTVEEEHAFIQKYGVLITPELYTALEYLRKSQKDTSCL